MQFESAVGDKVANLSTGASSAGSFKQRLSALPNEDDRFIPLRADVTNVEGLLHDSSINSADVSLNETLKA